MKLPAVGKAVTREDAIGLLQDVFHHHDSSLGITWGLT